MTGRVGAEIPPTCRCISVPAATEERRERGGVGRVRRLDVEAPLALDRAQPGHRGPRALDEPLDRVLVQRGPAVVL